MSLRRSLSIFLAPLGILLIDGILVLMRFEYLLAATIVSCMILFTAEFWIFWPAARRFGTTDFTRFIGKIVFPIAVFFICLYICLFACSACLLTIYSPSYLAAPTNGFSFVELFIIQLMVAAVGLLMAIIIATLTNPDQRQSIEEWWRNVFRYPLSKLMSALLWIYALVTAFELIYSIPSNLTTPTQNIYSLTESLVNPNNGIFSILLPPGLALLVYVLPYKLPLLTQFVLLLTLAITSRGRVSSLWKVILVGIGLGSFATGLLVNPIQNLVLAQVRPDYVNSINSTEFQNSFAFRGVIGAIALVLSGPLTVLWTRAEYLSKRLRRGALAGALAGMVLFGGVGAPATGILSQMVLYGAAFSRSGYGPVELGLKVASAVNRNFSWTIGTFLAFLIGGLLLGGITGVLTRIRFQIAGEPEEQVNPLSIPLIVFPLMTFTGILEIILPMDLGLATRHAYDLFGLVPSWNPEWNLAAVFGITWLCMTAMQAWILIGLQTSRDEGARNSAGEIAGGVIFCGLTGLFFTIGACFFSTSGLFQQPFILVEVLFTGMLALEILVEGWSIRKISAGEHPVSTNWGRRLTSGASAGIFTSIVFQLLASIGISLVFISIVFIPDLVLYDQPPSGLKLLDWLLFVFPLQLAFSNSLLMLGAVIGAIAIVFFTWGEWIRRFWIWSVGRLKAFLLRMVVNRFRSTRVMVLLLLLLVVIIVASNLIFSAPFFLALLVLWISLVLIRPDVVERIPKWGQVLAFGIAIFGVIGLSLSGTHMIQYQNMGVLQSAFIIMFVPALVVTYRAILLVTPANRSTAARLGMLSGIIVLLGATAYISQDKISTKGGLARYDGSRWETFQGKNNLFAGHLNYQLYLRHDGSLWFGGGTGILLSQSNSTIQVFKIRYDFPSGEMLSEETVRAMGGRMKFIEDRSGRLWVALGNDFGLFDEELANSDYSLRLPQRSQPAEWLKLASPVIAMTLDQSGYLWLALEKGGLLRLDANRDPQDTKWDSYSASDGSLPSDIVLSLFADQAGNVWVGTSDGLVRFDGQSWHPVTCPETNQGCLVTAFEEDGQGRLWMAYNASIARYDGLNWNVFDQTTNWPDGMYANHLFVDSQGGVWAGGSKGVVRYDGHTWSNLVSDKSISVFAEGPKGTVWLGTSQGLIRYDLASGNKVIFTTANSILESDAVQDVLVDQNGDVWVSTFSIQRGFSASWPAFILGFLTLIGLCVYYFRVRK